ncbi:hypothetical protein [Qipengyuania sp.]|uniref:hypothetical protein n=1 Tax=Qipengyuania sp. TaxID=2004515 RepID=UPI003BAC5B77
MKPVLYRSWTQLGGALALTFTIAACVPAPESTPAPTGSPTPTPTPTATTPPPPPPAPPPSENWIDEPRTAGSWTYRTAVNGGLARFGDSSGQAQFSIGCERDAGRILLTRAGQGPRQAVMTIRTETAERTLPARPAGGGSPQVVATLSATDPLLDAMALTRGRFAVEISGLSTLYLPPWAEVTRAIEACR